MGSFTAMKEIYIGSYAIGYSQLSLFTTSRSFKQCFLLSNFFFFCSSYIYEITTQPLYVSNHDNKDDDKNQPHRFPSQKSFQDSSSSSYRKGLSPYYCLFFLKPSIFKLYPSPPPNSGSSSILPTPPIHLLEEYIPHLRALPSRRS